MTCPALTRPHLDALALLLADESDGLPPASSEDRCARMAGANDALFLGKGRLVATETNGFALEVITKQGAAWVGETGTVTTPGKNARPVETPHSSTFEKNRVSHVLRFESMAGVGMRLSAESGTPLDEEELVALLWEFSCHPHFGRTIVRDLARYGTRSTTVMRGLINQWRNLTQALAPLGVAVERTEPWPPQGPAQLPEGTDTPLPRRFRTART